MLRRIGKSIIVNTADMTILLPGPEAAGQAGNGSLLEIAFQTAPIGLLIARQRVIVVYNRTFSDMFGYEPDELIEESLDRLYPSPQEFQHIGDRAAQAMRQTGFYSDERIMRHRSGSLFWCHVTGRAFDQADPLQAATWVFEDISVQRPITAQLTAREREVSQLLVLGQSSKLIARTLGISPRTVEAHRTRLMRKLNAASASELVAKLLGRNVGGE